MPNGDKTTLEPAAVKSSGEAIKTLGSDVRGYATLNDINPKPGDFQVGDWLRELVTARRDELHQHCNELSAALEEVGQKLQQISNEIEATDQSPRIRYDRPTPIERERVPLAREGFRAIPHVIPTEGGAQALGKTQVTRSSVLTGSTRQARVPTVHGVC
jgi:hypothetical protein